MQVYQRQEVTFHAYIKKVTQTQTFSVVEGDQNDSAQPT